MLAIVLVCNLATQSLEALPIMEGPTAANIVLAFERQKLHGKMEWGISTEGDENWDMAVDALNNPGAQGCVKGDDQSDTSDTKTEKHS